MLLREHLNEYTEELLRAHAARFGLQPPEEADKEELVDGLTKFYLDRNVLRSRVGCLTKEQLDIFTRSLSKPQKVEVLDIANGVHLSRFWLGYFNDMEEEFCAYEDVAEAFERIDCDELRAEFKKKNWLVKCLIFFTEYYVMAPLEVVYKLYRLKVKDSIDDMIALLWNMPVDIVEAAITSLEKLGIKECPKDAPLYTEKGLLVNIPAFNDDDFEELIAKQQTHDFYIPTAQQIDFICRFRYEAGDMAYKKLEKYFMNNMDMNYEMAVSWCREVWKNSYNGESPANIVNKLQTGKGNALTEQKKLDEFVAILVDAHNNTRRRENRGYTPNELSARASAAADVKEDDNRTAPEKEVQKVEAAKADKKVYPNDPCPCGSGKKYKKCCGKALNS